MGTTKNGPAGCNEVKPFKAFELWEQTSAGDMLNVSLRSPQGRLRGQATPPRGTWPLTGPGRILVPEDSGWHR